MVKINKKGASVIIGYVLLVTFGLVMSGIAYNYLKTYVPTEIVNCPDDSSLFLKDITCNAISGELNITIKNNGKFNLDGFFINSASDPDDTIATDNLNGNFINDSRGTAIASTTLGVNYIRFHFADGKENDLRPTEEGVFWFNLSKTAIPVVVKLIEITPTIIKFENERPDLALCSNAKIRQTITCS